jgi:hypothetical protein
MLRKLVSLGLLLTLALSAAGCGSNNNNTGTSARGWNSTTSAAQNRTASYDAESRGPLSDGAYSADKYGRVSGYDTDGSDAKTDGSDAKSDLDQAGNDLKDATENIGSAAKNTARSIGDATEDALDRMTGTTEQTTH